MRTLKITLIATAIATAASFWGAELGLMQKVWPQQPQIAGFVLCLLACIVVQLFWPKDSLEGQKNKT